MLDLKILEFTKVLAEGCIKLLDILVLLSVLDGLGKLREALHWLLDSLIEAVSPVEGSGDRRQVVGNGCSFIDLVDKSLTLKENLLDCLKILLVKLQECNVLLLKLILDDWSVEKTLEGVEELELANDGV